VHRPVACVEDYRADLSYLGTYLEDRQAALQALFLDPAHRLPHRRFLIGGSLYPSNFPWTVNSYYRQHVPPSDHPSFYCSSRMTLNITRHPLAQMRYCPSGRLFEAAACRVPILSDFWEGLDEFFEPGREILVGRSADDTVRALDMPCGELKIIARDAHERTLSMHTADRRAVDFEHAFESVH
jgi:spore maturation protein CgeB